MKFSSPLRGLKLDNADMSRCLKWIKWCGRPHDQLNVSKIKRHHVVCSKVRLCGIITALVLPGLGKYYVGPVG